MQVNFIKSSSIKDFKSGVCVIFLSENQVSKSKISFIKNARENFDFHGKYAQACFINNRDSSLILFGSGGKAMDSLMIQKLSARLVSFLNSAKVSEANIFFGFDFDAKEELKQINFNIKEACDLAFGAILQSYRFNKYFEKRKKEKELKITKFNIVVKDVSAAKKMFIEQEILAKNIFFTRDLVSEPANILNPESYATICKTLVKSGLQVEILGESEMKKLGMNALLGVGQGSSKESKLVILKWNGAGNSSKPIAFVGKGVTFDTGGISIKPANNMEDMKTDMAGSAVVVGLLKNLAERKAKVNAVGVIGLVENMPSGTAQRPGDVVKSMSGQTIEIINTDAEGRLVLADALYYTNQKFKPEFIVDLATLTGAIIIALADIHAGLFSNSDELSSRLLESGNNIGEPLWRLPISDEYDEMINSDIADMRNTGAGRGAGSITAAQFLKRFIGDTKWAHLDIAGVAWKGKGDPLAVKGATGFGLRLLNDLVKNFYEKK